jgi:hypothetical protein
MKVAIRASSYVVVAVFRSYESTLCKLVLYSVYALLVLAKLYVLYAPNQTKRLRFGGIFVRNTNIGRFPPPLFIKNEIL